MLKALGQFIDDAHPRVVSMALGYIQSQKSVFIDESNEDVWAKFITAKAQSALNKYGVTAKQGEEAAISKLRPQLISLLAFYGDEKQLTHFTQAFETTPDPQARTNLLMALSYFGNKHLQL